MAAAIPPPTPELAELASVVGEANARELARTFLANTPPLIADIVAQLPATSAEPAPCQIAAHSLKSTARLVGARDLSALAAALEARLACSATLLPRELAALRAEAARALALIAPFAARGPKLNAPPSVSPRIPA